MLRFRYKWMCKCSNTKPTITMVGVCKSVTGNSKSSVKDSEILLMMQALGYIDYAKRMGAKLIPMRVNPKSVQSIRICFKLKFKNNAKMNKFERYITKQ